MYVHAFIHSRENEKMGKRKPSIQHMLPDCLQNFNAIFMVFFSVLLIKQGIIYEFQSAFAQKKGVKCKFHIENRK